MISRWLDANKSNELFELTSQRLSGLLVLGKLSCNTRDLVFRYVRTQSSKLRLNVSTGSGIISGRILSVCLSSELSER